MNLALFLPNWVGDLVMATPTLRALRRHFGPAARIVGIMRPNLAELLAGTHWLDEQWYFDPRSPHAQWRRLALVTRIRRERFDMAILLTNSLHTAVLAWLGQAKERVGYAWNLRGPLLTTKLDAWPMDGWLPRRRPPPAPVVETYLTLARTVGCSAESPRLELALTPTEQRLGAEIWRDLGLRPGRQVIALNSSGAYGAAKRWPVERCGALARQIVRRAGYDVLVLCGPGEQGMAREIVAYAASPRVFSLAGHVTGLPVTKACLARSRLLVSTDSGPRHIAAALGTPVVTLLGPTLPAWSENPTVRGRVVRLDDLDCTGCGKRVCPLGHHRCMRDLMPEKVLEEMMKLLEGDAVKAA